MKIFLPGFLGAPEDFPNCNAIPLPEKLSDLLSYGKNLTLIGYSMGGRIALMFTHQYPEAVKEVIAISANPGIDPSEIPKRILWEKKWLAVMKQSDFIEKWYAQPLFASLRNSKNFPEMLQRRKQVNLEEAHKLFAHYRLSKQPNLWEKLPEMPVRFVFGELDEKYLPIHERLLRMGIESQLVPNCGHAIPVEVPHRVFSMK
ncbi:MAG: alpha/beta fold hydrolase [Candidatus Algichlamydia australiensis]|nr:alpha/beta fold hydrolase [Chlamydiales bacterium]